MQKVVFKEDHVYSDRPTPETDKAWDDLLPVYLPPSSSPTL